MRELKGRKALARRVIDKERHRVKAVKDDPAFIAPAKSSVGAARTGPLNGAANPASSAPASNHAVPFKPLRGFTLRDRPVRRHMADSLLIPGTANCLGHLAA